MLTIHCPAAIRFVLECHYLQVPIERKFSPIERHALAVCLERKLIVENKGEYYTTELGRKWVENIVNTRIPER